MNGTTGLAVRRRTQSVDDQPTLDEILSLFGGPGTGVKVVDTEQRITAWDQGARDLLGFEAGEVVGEPCPETTRGHDDSGTLVCRTGCEVIQSVRRREPVRRYTLLTRTKRGDAVWVRMNVVVVRAADVEGPVAVHLMRPAGEPIQAPAKERPAPAAHPEAGPGLTRREREVLRLLAAGKGVQEIAEEFVVSPATVRNHIASVLGKLGVHTRLQAVVLAAKLGLLGG